MRVFRLVCPWLRRRQGDRTEEALPIARREIVGDKPEFGDLLGVPANFLEQAGKLAPSQAIGNDAAILSSDFAADEDVKKPKQLSTGLRPLLEFFEEGGQCIHSGGLQPTSEGHHTFYPNCPFYQSAFGGRKRGTSVRSAELRVRG